MTDRNETVRNGTVLGKGRIQRFATALPPDIPGRSAQTGEGGRNTHCIDPRTLLATYGMTLILATIWPSFGSQLRDARAQLLISVSWGIV